MTPAPLREQTQMCLDTPHGTHIHVCSRMKMSP
jgi:hypothetical protein